MKRAAAIIGLLFLTCGFSARSAAGQSAPRPAPPVERLGANLFRVGQIRVDTAKREITVQGSVNDVTVLEFVANTKAGFKAYESALTIDTDAVTFNTALVLIGLDKAHARPPEQHFDSRTPEGDLVEVWIEWGVEPARRRVRAEQLLFDKVTNQPVPDGPWVYTASMFLADGRYLAELDGTLVGFVHSPAPIIESSRGAGLGNYGSIVLNPNLGLTPNMPVTLTVKAIGQSAGGRR